MAGLIVPSAALPGTQNIVLFGARVASGYLARPLSALDVPASITAEAGRPPESLPEIVRYRGEPHPELVAHELGRPFRFTEPDWSLAGA